MVQFKKVYTDWKRKKILKFLTDSDPTDIIAFGEKHLIPAFKRAATKMPAYATLLRENNVNHEEIKTVEDFTENIPIFSKNDFFADTPINELCINKDIYSMKLAMSSSGFSGVYSFGINTKQNQDNIAFSIDTSLEYLFKISKQKTFLVNCVPMGVKIPTSLPIAETSIRSDMALAIIKKFSPFYEQFIIVSDPHFLKKIIEDGIEQGIDWKKMMINLIAGEDWFSESFRLYLSELVGIDIAHPEKGFFAATMGIAELDLNLFHDSIDTIRLRQELQNNTSLKHKLFGKGINITPLIFHYFPHRVFLETTNNDELVFTMLSQQFLIPLIRYNSQDQGYIRSYEFIKKVLTEEGYPHLIPELKLPLVAVAGRKGRWLSVKGKIVTPEEIKEGLYSDFEVAFLTTGYFKLSQKSVNDGKIEIQLKEGVKQTEDLKAKFTNALLKYVDADLEIQFYHYHDFPYGMVLDYESKFKCI